jgi:putative acetyltransferase
MSTLIRFIQESDNLAVEIIIKSSLKEHGVNKPGTAYYDESTANMYASYTVEKSAYFVAVDIENNVIVGGAGIFPTKGLPNGTCELVKMYMHQDYRGKGISSLLMKQCELFAREQGFNHIYLETMPELAQAVDVYKRFNFKQLDASLGDSGHFSCTIWMLKEIR